MGKTTFYILFLLLQATTPLHGSCLTRIKRLLKPSPQKIITFASIEDLAKSLPLDARLKEQMTNLSPKSRERIFQLLSRVPKIAPSSRKIMGRRKDIRDTLAKVITEEGLFERLFVRGIENYASLTLTERRALNLMLNEDWWFRRSPPLRNQKFDKFIRISHYIENWQGGSRFFDLQRFLDEMAQTPFWQRIFNRFAYIGYLQKKIDTAPHSSDLLKKLVEEKTILVDELRHMDRGRSKSLLEGRLKHLEHLISIASNKDFPSPLPRKLPDMAQLVRGTENFVFTYAPLYIAYWAFSRWLELNNEETAAQNDVLPISNWNVPVVESLDDALPSDQDEILIQCNSGLIPEEKCLELLSADSQSED